LDGDVLDGLSVAAYHFEEGENQSKVFKEKRIIVLTDFGCKTANDSDIKKICKNLVQNEIRVDVISPEFSETRDDIESEKGAGDGNESEARGSGSEQPGQPKTLTLEQKRVQNVLRSVCEATEGALYSSQEALTLLSNYQAKAVRSSGTKYMLRLGQTFKMPIVSVINCKESKPDLFKFKKVKAKTEYLFRE